jgi:hypothetical protein
MSKVVHSYQQAILIPLLGADLRIALQAINEANGRAPDAPFTLESVCQMSAKSARVLTIDVYSDGTRRIRGAQ